MITFIAVSTALSLSFAAISYAQSGGGDPQQPQSQMPAAANAQADPPEVVPGQQPRDSVRVDPGSISVPGQAMHTGRSATAQSPARPCSPGSQSQRPAATSSGPVVGHERSTKPCPR
jgi:hypothetical protein